MTDDLTGLLRAVIENPDDDHVRLVYADALDELPTQRVKCHVCGGCGSLWGHKTGQYGCGACKSTGEVVDTFPQERAELIRVQCELTRFPHHTVPSKEVNERYNDLVARETFLLEQLRRRGLLTGREDYVRGFVETWTGTADEWFKVEDKLFWHGGQTVQKLVKCTDCDGDGKRTDWMVFTGTPVRRKCDNPLCVKGSIKFEKVPPTYEERSGYACKCCGNTPDEYGCIDHGRGCNTQDENGGGTSWVTWPDKVVPRPLPPSAHPLRKVVLTKSGSHPEVLEDQFCEDRWPGLTVELTDPSEGTEVASDDDESWGALDL